MPDLTTQHPQPLTTTQVHPDGVNNDTVTLVNQYDDDLFDDILLGTGAGAGTHFVFKRGLDKAQQFGRTVKENYQSDTSTNGAPKAYAGVGGTLVDAALHGTSFDPYRAAVPLAVGVGASTAYGSAAPITVGGFNVTHGPWYTRFPASLTYTSIFAPAAAATGSDVGTGVYNNFYKNYQTQLHDPQNSPEYNNFWSNRIADTSNVLQGGLGLFDPVGRYYYGNSWDSKKQGWANNAGIWANTLPMAWYDLNKIAFEHPFEYTGTVLQEVGKQPGKWVNWAQDTWNMGRELAGPGGRFLIKPQLYKYGLPILAQNMQDASPIKVPDIFYTSYREPENGPDFSGYAPRMLNYALEGDNEALRNTILSIAENRAAIKNGNLFYPTMNNFWWHINHVGLNPFNWGKDVQLPQDPSLGKTPKVRFNELVSDAEALQDSAIPSLPNFYNIARELEEGRMSETTVRSLHAIWNSLPEDSKEKIRRVAPNVDNVMSNFDTVEQGVSKVLNKGGDELKKVVDKYPSENPSKSEGPSIVAIPDGYMGIPNYPREERYFEWNNPDYRWPKLFDGYLENIPLAPLMNSLMSYPLAGIRDSVNLAKDRAGSAARSAGQSLRAGVRGLMPQKPATPPPHPSQPESVEKLPDGTIIKHDWRYGRNAPAQVF